MASPSLIRFFHKSEASESPRPSARKKIKLDTEDEGSDVGTKERKRREGKVRGKGKGKATTAAAPVRPSSLPFSPLIGVLMVPVQPEDERVKELKSIVVACGVRKQWYAGPSPQRSPIHP